MAQERVLIVDDDFEARLLLRTALEQNGYQVEEAFNAEEGIALLHRRKFDLVLLDILMPFVDGLEACRRIRRFSNVPIIMLTAVDTEKVKVEGLDSGADDYVTKPFSREELLSRIRAVLRRTRPPSTPETTGPPPPVQVGALRLDFSAQRATLGEREIPLSGKEFMLLYTLARRVGELLSREELFAEVWGDEVYWGSKTLEVHIYRLRKKLEQYAGLGHLLITVRNRGYLLSSEIKTTVTTQPVQHD
ncbi:MAG TPA: response regulator transcription factor [Armatimonadetes bacterium]|nr:response regulator transcription factor [Armatimonadota bacterium]